MAFTKVQSGFIDLSTSSGLSVGTGTASVPAINFGTSNTGLLGDNDEVAISVSGSRILTAKNGNLGINTSSPSHRLEVAGTTRTSYLSLPSPGSGNAAISVDSFNAGDIIRRTTGTGSGTNLGLIYSNASVYLAYHMYANRNPATFEEYPLKSSSSATVKRAGIIVGNHGISLGTGLNYTASVDEAIPHEHFTYNLINNAGDLILNQHTSDNTGNRGIFFRVGANQEMPLSNLSKGLINFKRTNDFGAGRLDFILGSKDNANSVTVSDTTSLSLSYDQNTVGLPTEFGPANKYGDIDVGNNSGPTVAADQLAKGRHYIQLQANHANNPSNSNDPAWIAWKGSTSRGENLSTGAATTVPFGGYCARIGGYRDKRNDGSTSIGWETVQDVNTLPHTMTRQMTLRYDGKIAMGNNLEPDCHLDMSDVTTAIRVPNGTTAERPSTAGTAGQLRYNTDTTKLEYSNGTNWNNLGAVGQIETTSGDATSTSGGKRTVEFRSSGTFTNTGSAQVAEIFVIGGGGGGGGGGANSGSTGGGGGGMVYGSVEVPAGSFSVTVGGGGTGAIANGSNNGSAPAAGSGVTSSVTINGVTFQATGGGGAPATSSGNGGGSSYSVQTGPNGGTGTINGGTSYTSPALRDGTLITPVYGTGGKGGNSGGMDGSGNGPNATDGDDGTNGGAGGGGGGDNLASANNNGPAGEGGNGDSAYFTGGGGGGGADGDGSNTANLASGGTGLHSGGTGGDFDSSATDGGGPSGGSRGQDGNQRKNAGGGGGSFGGGGGGAGDASNSHGGQGGSGGGGLVVIRFLI